MNDKTAQLFLSSLSHEFRTPLNGIIGYLQLLQNTRLDTTQQGYVSASNKCCMQLLEIVNDILDFCKLSTGKATLKTNVFTIRELLDEMNSVLEYRIREKNQKIHYIVEDNVPEYIVSDKQKLVQVLINLVSNANKFTQANGRIIVTVTNIKKESTSIPELLFSVEDDGIGISEEDQKKLFKPFSQVKDTGTKVGVGLGLVISQKIVELFGGTIRIESEIAKGTTFSFNIKYENYDNYQKVIEQNSYLLASRFVLVLDSDTEERLNIADILSDVGIYPILCSTMKEASKMLSNKRYNFLCALLDTTFGSEVATKLKEIKEIAIIGKCAKDVSSVDRKPYFSILYKPSKIQILDCLLKLLKEPTEEKRDTSDRRDKEQRILVVEDVDYNLDMLVKMCNSYGYKNIDSAIDGEEAITKLNEKTYDIVLLDLKMPKKNGYEVTCEIRNGNTKTNSRVPIVIITACIADSDKEQFIDKNVEYLLKPFNANRLRHILRFATK